MAGSFSDNLRKSPKAAAWGLLVGALMLHVIDEAVTGFLPFYNETVLALREQWGIFPMPTFTFESWISGLALGLLLLALATPAVGRGQGLARVVTTIFGVLMVGNALGHLLGSVYLERILPGFWSSWILLPAAGNVVRQGVRGQWGGAEQEDG